LQQKGIRTGRQGFHQTIVGVAYLGVGTDFGQIAANQGEMVMLVGAANALDALHRRLVADMATQRIARIRGINYQSAAVDDRHRLLNQAPLGIIRMNFEKLGHELLDSIRPRSYRNSLGRKQR